MFKPHFTGGQIFGLIGLGGIFWISGVIIIRNMSHILFQNRRWQIVSYFAGFPLFYIMLGITEAILGLDARHRLIATTLMSAVASMMDGTALMYFPTLYENPDISKRNPQASLQLSRMGAAWLLWVFGVGFAVALLTNAY